MTTYRFVALAALTILGACGAGTAHAQSYRHVAQLALTLRGQCSRLASELRYHYRGLPGYEHIYGDVREMYRLSNHIHTIVHHGEEMHHVAEDARELDTLFHHVQELVAEAGHEALHDDLGGPHDHYDHSHHSYGDPHRLEVRLAAMEDTLHHLLEDVEHLEEHEHEHEHAHEHEHVEPTPSIILRGGRFSIRLGD